jgi:lactaldehyde reductase
VKALAVKVGIPEKLRELNVTEESLEKLALSAFNDVCTPGNPREVKLEDVLELYRTAY